MEDDEDDFFAYQTAKSLNNKRTQLKQFFQAPITSKQISSSSESNSDSDDELISIKKSKPTSVNIPLQPIIIEPEPIKSKDEIKNEINAIVTSCFSTANKEIKRKIKLGKRTSADDQEYEDEDEYLTNLIHHHHHQHGNRHLSRAIMNSLNKSQLEEDEEKVTRETAAYNRLDAVLRVTKPLCEKQIESIDDEDEDDDEPVKSDLSNVLDPVKSISFDTITLKIDHSDGRQLTLTLPLITTLKDLYKQVAERLSLSSIYLVYNNQTLKLDDENQFMTLKQLKFSSNSIQLIESYPLIKKLKIFIQTSNSSSNRHSSLSSKREYTMMDSDRFEMIFDAYKRDMKSTNIRFEFDGDTLNPHATPIDYDMIDGEILDAFILPTSKQMNKKKPKEILFDEEESDN
jgi:hypothetical protein